MASFSKWDFGHGWPLKMDQCPTPKKWAILGAVVKYGIYPVLKNGIYMDLPSVGDYTISSVYGKSIIFRAHWTVVHQNGLAGPTSPRRSMRPP